MKLRGSITIQVSETLREAASWKSCLKSGFGFIFLFQAEDGIRDTSVTGVQTCALPISKPPGRSLDPAGNRGARGMIVAAVPQGASEQDPAYRSTPADWISPMMKSRGPVATEERSEERRVGKECGYRGARDL